MAGETTSCKQQVRSLLRRGVMNPNLKKCLFGGSISYDEGVEEE